MQQNRSQLHRRCKEATDFAAVIQPTLHKLASAYGYARDVECDPWQFAVEIGGLTAIGVSMGDLRWLTIKGYVEHALEITRPNDALRKFKPGRNLAFTEKTSFIITDAGLAVVDNKPAKGNRCHFSEADAAIGTENALPRWDRETHVLCVGTQIVKQYRVPSPNQEAILTVFQEEGWPTFIHDPLPPAGDQPPKQRLRETIRCLNANQKSSIIRFRGDGTGERVCWELVANGVSHVPAIQEVLRPTL